MTYTFKNNKICFFKKRKKEKITEMIQKQREKNLFYNI